jgi:hypothetical protein
MFNIDAGFFSVATGVKHHFYLLELSQRARKEGYGDLEPLSEAFHIDSHTIKP